MGTQVMDIIIPASCREDLEVVPVLTHEGEAEDEGQWVWSRSWKRLEKPSRESPSLRKLAATRQRKAGFQCPRGSGKVTKYEKPCPGELAVFADLLDSLIVDVATEVHRATRLGLNYFPSQGWEGCEEEQNNGEVQHEHEEEQGTKGSLTVEASTSSGTPDQMGLPLAQQQQTPQSGGISAGKQMAAMVDVFGQTHPAVASENFECLNCGRPVVAGRYAPHLEKCMGKAYFRLEKDGKVEKVLHSLTLLVEDSLPFDIVLGMDWGEAAGATLHLKEHECRLPSSSGEAKTARLFHVSGVENSLAHCCLSAPAFARLVKKEKLEEQVFVAYIRPVTEPKKEKPVDPTIAKLLEEFKDLTKPPTGTVPWPIQHCIEIEPGSRTPKGAVYRMSPRELEELRKQLGELLEKGWIRPSSSPFGAPVLFVPKKEGELRMCIDYRGLNAITVKNAEPLPRIDDLLDRVQGAKYFSKIDLKSGYHQIEVHPDDQYKTAFRTRYGHYEFIVMPFGLTNAPATFQRCMDNLFRSWLDRFVVVYLDDILVFSKTLDEHQGHLRQVLEKLREANFKINAKKCDWAKTQVLYLGHVLDGDGVKPEDSKIAAIRDWPTPRTLTELRSFLGLANYYRKFVRNFSTIATPLRRLLRKETIWKWDKDCTSAMKKLKQALIEYPVLKVADPSLPFVVTTDASQYGIGAVLQQDDGNGYRPVEFMSARMPSEKVATSTYERELYALRQVLDHWKHYLLGRHFKVYSDHETLRWLKTQAKMTPKLTRWAAEIDQYDFELKPVKGKYNVVADALSRRADYFGAIVHYLDIGKDLQQKVRESYAQDPIYSELLTRVKEALETEPNYRTTEGLLFEKTNVFDYLCIPNSEDIRSLILGECHDTEGHFGWQETLANLMRAYTWPGMKNDCVEYVRSCKVCQSNKSSTRAPLGLLSPLPIPDQPGDSVSIDFMDTQEEELTVFTGWMMQQGRISSRVASRNINSTQRRSRTSAVGAVASSGSGGSGTGSPRAAPSGACSSSPAIAGLAMATGSTFGTPLSVGSAGAAAMTIVQSVGGSQPSATVSAPRIAIGRNPNCEGSPGSGGIDSVDDVGTSITKQDRKKVRKVAQPMQVEVLPEGLGCQIHMCTF
ncbi:hypothetical protein CBR_g49952 [Chara braunii]|uniref:SAGA-associated factor 11 n=1 Tax=Chara braunii TaxID=69332 RepID=A0A388K567_CHABU|nr:hypothetical protein CBR_g49952 [Chara braunii]|eukprot:GBG65156.1 hypothetical protein CBR_g49952 [Chara braunii]